MSSNSKSTGYFLWQSNFWTCKLLSEMEFPLSLLENTYLSNKIQGLSDGQSIFFPLLHIIQTFAVLIPDYMRMTNGAHLWEARSSCRIWEDVVPPSGFFSSWSLNTIFLSCHVFLCSFVEACQNVLQPITKVFFSPQSYPGFHLFNCKNTESVLAARFLKFISDPNLQGTGDEKMFGCSWFLMSFSTSYSSLLTFWGFGAVQIKFLIA